MYQLQPRQWDLKASPTNMLREVINIAAARVQYIEDARPIPPYALYDPLVRLSSSERDRITDDLQQRTSRWKELAPYTKLLLCPLACSIIRHHTDRGSWAEYELTRCFDLGHIHVAGTCISVEVRRVMKHDEGLVTLL